MFDKIVKPILLNGYEVWGFGNIVLAEKLHLKTYLTPYVINTKAYGLWRI